MHLAYIVPCSAVADCHLRLKARAMPMRHADNLQCAGRCTKMLQTQHVQWTSDRVTAKDGSVQVFLAFSAQPVASASLGQVYQATLRPEFGGGCVAVKVQRPGVMEHVALDTLLMRGATEIVSAVPYFSDSWCEVLDDWASRFFQVCDGDCQSLGHGLNVVLTVSKTRVSSRRAGVSRRRWALHERNRRPLTSRLSGVHHAHTWLA